MTEQLTVFADFWNSFIEPTHVTATSTVAKLRGGEEDVPGGRPSACATAACKHVCQQSISLSARAGTDWRIHAHQRKRVQHGKCDRIGSCLRGTGRGNLCGMATWSVEPRDPTRCSRCSTGHTFALVLSKVRSLQKTSFC